MSHRDQQPSQRAFGGPLGVRSLVLAGLAVAGLSGPSLAKPDSAPAQQPAPAAQPAGQSAEEVPHALDPRQQTLLRMERRLTFKVDGKRLEEVMEYLKQVTQADIEPIWLDDQQQGLEKDTPVTINVVNRPALNVLEMILSKVQTGGGIGSLGTNTWQLTAEGTLQCGPREALNRTHRLQIYDINDLLLVIPNYPEVPQIDLSSVLQQSQGGGGGTNPFQNANNQNLLTPQQLEQARQDRIKAIIEIIQASVETEQWNENGGDGGTIRVFNGSLLINAADYIHRQINGYSFWPSGYESRSVGKRRSVTLNMGTERGQAKAKMTRYEPTPQAETK